MENSITAEPKYYDEAGKGRKLCVCGKFVAARSVQCPCCKNVFNAEALARIESRQVEIKEIETYNEPGQGRKQCQKCFKYISARRTSCKCGHTFEAKEKEVAAFDTPAEGLRQCLSCEKYIGNRYRECPNCGEKQDKLTKVKTTDSEYDEAIACPPTSCIPGNPSKYKVIIAPSGECPVKLTNTEPTTVAQWVEDVLNYGYRKNIIYSLFALKYYVSYFFHWNTPEHNDACRLIDNHKFEKLDDEEEDYE